LSRKQIASYLQVMAARMASELTKSKTSSYSWASEGRTGRPCLPGFWNL